MEHLDRHLESDGSKIEKFPGGLSQTKATLIKMSVDAKIYPPAANEIIFSLTKFSGPEKRRRKFIKESDVSGSEGEGSHIFVDDESSSDDPMYDEDTKQPLQILWDTTPIFNRTETEMVRLPHDYFRTINTSVNPITMMMRAGETR